MIQTVTAIERDGFDVRVLTLLFDVPNKDFDLKTAVCRAATDYCKTENGRKTYDYNCSYFNWADFAGNVPSEFCEKYGFRLIDTALSDIEVDWDEQLVSEDEVDEFWADDDEEEQDTEE